MLLRTLRFATAIVLALPAAPCWSQDRDPSFSAEQVAAGAALYDAYCARCHGAGMVEPGDGFFDLRTFPADQRNRFIRSVSNGKNSMPPWRSVLSAQDIADLFAYVVSGAEGR